MVLGPLIKERVRYRFLILHVYIQNMTVFRKKALDVGDIFFVFQSASNEIKTSLRHDINITLFPPSALTHLF